MGLIDDVNEDIRKASGAILKMQHVCQAMVPTFPEDWPHYACVECGKHQPPQPQTGSSTANTASAWQALADKLDGHPYDIGGTISSDLMTDVRVAAAMLRHGAAILGGKP